MNDGLKVLTFLLGEQLYAIDLLCVKEIIRVPPITELPHAPFYAEGVINLRGKIIPVISLAKRLRKPAMPYDENPFACVIVFEPDPADKSILVGMTVDSVADVVTVKNEQLEAPPEVYGQNTDCVRYLINLPNTIAILLDARRLVDPNELMDRGIVDMAEEK